MTEQIRGDLPEWFRCPRPIKIWQQSLFQIKLSDALVRFKISPDDLARWKSKGWVSFDGTTEVKIDGYDDPRIFELLFVRDTVRSGLTDAQIDFILSLLPKPFAFDPTKIAFSFRYGWVEPAPSDPPETDPPESVIEENLDAWLESLDFDELQDIKERIEEIIVSHKEDTTGEIE